ncbi:MAG: HEAT repeat domain-containing protein [Acidobacteria bacterium]|nr:HEAT repeat domain-containing protein [Acidobacteriota bacterium]
MIRSMLLLCAAAVPMAAQQPAIANANLQTASAANGLDAAVKAAIARQSTAAWIGYAVPKIPGDRQSCCWSDDGRGCGLEGRTAGPLPVPAGPVKLEGPSHIAVLFRVEQGAVVKIRNFSIDCPLDAGGLPFHWLSNVRIADSVAVLTQYALKEEALTDRRRRVNESAVQALALHEGGEAETALEKFALSGQTVETRKTAAFWLANSRGKRGYEVVVRVLRDDTNEKVREHAIFALTQSREPEAIPVIVRAAKEDKSPHVRGQALFWLAQKASKQAIGPINDSIAADPETEVKKKAVFALTQIPNGEGIPTLIQVARNNQNPAVRKQAMFWLGQSKDPRAIRFFEEVLAK